MIGIGIANDWLWTATHIISTKTWGGKTEFKSFYVCVTYFLSQHFWIRIALISVFSVTVLWNTKGTRLLSYRFCIIVRNGNHMKVCRSSDIQMSALNYVVWEQWDLALLQAQYFNGFILSHTPLLVNIWNLLTLVDLYIMQNLLCNTMLHKPTMHCGKNEIMINKKNQFMKNY